MRLFIILLLSGLVALCAACQERHNSADNTLPKLAPVRAPDKPLEPEWVRNAVLYECNVHNFSAAGNFAGLTAQLPRLKELGIDVLWLMPVHPIGKHKRKGRLGNPYSVSDFYAIHPDLGTDEELKALVRTAHEQGLKVILDWVPNHSAWDAVWKQQHPEYYTRYNGDFTVPFNEKGEPMTDWSDICDLDYNNPATRAAMSAAMQYWLREYDLDGFHCDMAGLVPNDFWAELRPRLDSIKPVFMLSEWQDEPLHFKSCFNANYGLKWNGITKDIWTGKQNAIALDTLLEFLGDYYPKDYYQLYFTQNNYENSRNGSENELYGSSAEAFNVLAFTWQGIPMLYNGQEDGLNQRLKSFERDPLHWRKYSRTAFFQTLTTLRHDNKALWSGKNGGKLVKIASSNDTAIYAFAREKDGDRVIVVLNLSKENHRVTVRPESGFEGAYANVFGKNTMQVTNEMQLNLKPWEYLVLSNK